MSHHHTKADKGKQREAPKSSGNAFDAAALFKTHVLAATRNYIVQPVRPRLGSYARIRMFFFSFVHKNSPSFAALFVSTIPNHVYNNYSA
jgi:hypothetical protein